MDDQRRSNPKAAQVRVEARKATAYAGQRNHDLRRGAQPSYVDTTKAANNEILIEPPAPGVLRNINEGRRSQRDTKRAMRSDAAVAFTGILTFGHEAQAMFEALPRERQAEAFRDAAEAVAERLGTTLAGLVIHRDESAVHAHFVMPAYNLDGQPLTGTVKRNTLSDLQDVVAGAFQRYAPQIERGRSVAARAAAGATRAEMIHKSVRQLHADLPGEIAAKQAEVDRINAEAVEAAAKVAEMRARVVKLEEKETLTAAEVKRLATYRKRLEDRLAVQEAARAEAERLAEVARQEAAQAVQERDAARADEQAAKAKAARIASALKVLTEEIAGETIGRDEAGRVIAQNRDGLRDGFPDLKPAVFASADAIDAKRRLEADAAADRQRAADALKQAQVVAEKHRLAAAAAQSEAEAVKAEILTLRDRMRGVMTLLRSGLARVGVHLSKDQRAEAADAIRQAERLITPPASTAKPEKPADDTGFRM
uniref:Plasmid recombination enzyme n=1 Tax=uncultured prokaryote TaxID=198431 RepID=A0A0H5Q184_9ZZZZ|nr:hypothetical protein [uncultured prokaryote]